MPPMPNVPQVAKYLGTTVVGLVLGAAGAGIAIGDKIHDVTNARRVADETAEGLKEIRPEVRDLELWRAGQERDMNYIKVTLDEIKRDVKALRPR